MNMRTSQRMPVANVAITAAMVRFSSRSSRSPTQRRKEAITTGVYVRGFHHRAVDDGYFFCKGGGLGWGSGIIAASSA